MRILLAEDEKRMAAALAALLEQEKYDVDHAADGASSLEALQSGVSVQKKIVKIGACPDPGKRLFCIQRLF